MLNIKTQDAMITDLPSASEAETRTVEAPRKAASGQGTNRIYSGMWGKPEIVAVAAGGAVLLACIAVFATVVMPAKSKLEAARNEKVQLEQKVVEAREKYGRITSTTDQVARLVASADSFEANYLPLDSVGRTALYQRINSLIATHRLVNTSGPEYAPLPAAGQGGSQSQEAETGRERYRSIFPGVYVTMTVDGTYQDIRRFLSDIETSEQFVIISAVGIEPAEQRRRREETQAEEAPAAARIPGIPGPVNAPAPARTEQASGQKGETVSLKVELAAYFRRPVS